MVNLSLREDAVPVLRQLFFLLTLVALSAGIASAQDPVQWSLSWEPAAVGPGEKAVGKLTATIEPGWRLYAPTTPTDGPSGGPAPTKLELTGSAVVASSTIYQPKPEVKYDPIFEMDSHIFHDEVVFLIEAEISGDAALGDVSLEASAAYQACNDRVCLRRKTKKAAGSLTIASQASGGAPAIPPEYAEAKPAPKSPAANSGDAAAAAGSQGLLEFATVAFGFGLLAIFTPCVFPMIPITMSYFVSTDTGSRRDSVFQAIVFCGGIIVLFTGLGALVSVVLGPFGTVQLGASVWVNLFIALIFLVFAVSLFGAFEITVPSSALTSLNKMSQRGGVLGSLVMGLVFALASFACTGPFVGTLLAGSLQGGLGWPMFGMALFSSGMALPFFFLALFPAYLRKLPKSGGWLGRVKKTMAFLILAGAFKYLSNVDMMYQLEILTRERFLSIWVVLLALAAFYLLGFYRFPDEMDEDAGSVGLGRLATGGVFLVLALSLVPGMFNGRLGEVEAFIPPTDYSGFAGFGGASAAEENVWLKDDYEGALAKAKQTGSPLLITFTGYACSNCKWMKYNMFPKPEIAALTKNMVLLELYTDGQDEDSQANQDLQLERFKSVVIPYYALLRPDETVAAGFAGSTRDVEEFRRFLSSMTPQVAEAGPGG
jgi:thiol:disulfide interchange protein DsbD